MRVFHVGDEQFAEIEAQANAASNAAPGVALSPGGLPQSLPGTGFIWVSCLRSELQALLPTLQAALQRWTNGQLVDLHVSDLLNKQLPSHYDYTSWYDMLVFRRLRAAASAAVQRADEPQSPITAASVREVLASIDTTPVGFALFDRVLVTVHPGDCAVRDFFAQRMAALAPAGDARAKNEGAQGGAAGAADARADVRADVRGTARLPTSPADLMLRMVNHIVDGYLDLRRLLTRQLGALQTQLLEPKSRFADWHVLLDARNTLSLLEDISEDQHNAVQEWIDALDELPPDDDADRQRERELLRVRSRDVLEHIERVLSHVRRLEHSAETSVQMHFSALGNRTNDIMRTLTVLTAIFMPLNLITGFFGMNFERLPLIHSPRGFWVAFWLMVVLALGLGWWFRRKRYLGTISR